MTTQQLGLLLIQFLAFLSVLAFLGICLLRNREEKQKYRLFSVRDRLLFLAASGVLSQDSMVFKVFYRAMNAYIKELESVTLVSFIQASAAVRTQLEKENHEKLRDSLHRAEPEVQAVIGDFYSAIMDALRYNSPMLNLILTTAAHCHSVFVWIRKAQLFRVPVYDTYRFYETMYGTLVAA